MKLVSRGDTTVADAYLSPVLRRYVRPGGGAHCPARACSSCSPRAGSATRTPSTARTRSSPAPRAASSARSSAARAAGFDKIIAFDMGGTSTDVGHFAGEYERALDVEISGVRLRTPILRIHTVAAGGGSICRFDGVRLRVGPESAGANPGPAAYRRGGPLTVTDCNVLLGRIQPDYFPALFGPGRRTTAGCADRQPKFVDLAMSLPGRATRMCRTPPMPLPRRRGLHPHRRGEHGQCHQEDLGAARPRCHRVHAGVFRRRCRPARLPGRRRAGHAPRAHSSAGRRVVGVWHRSGRNPGHAAADRRTTAEAANHWTSCALPFATAGT